MMSTTSNVIGDTRACWRRIAQSSGPKPKPRHGHRAVAVNNFIVIFGGGNSGLIDHLSVYDPVKNEWTSPKVEGDIPFSRAAHGLAMCGDSVLLFGGMIEYGEYTDDLYELQTEMWQWKHLKFAIGDNVPSPRLGHSFTTVNDTVYLFGGVGTHIDPSGGKTSRYLNDLYTLQIHQGEALWKVPKTLSDAPPPRESHSCVAYFDETAGHHFLIIFGGMNGHRLGDVWILDTVTYFWGELQLCGTPPLPRSLHSANLVGERMYIFGGWVPVVPDDEKAEMLARGWKCTKSLACVNLGEMKWENVQEYPKKYIPKARTGHSATTLFNRIYIWSGRYGRYEAWHDPAFHEDMWYLEVDKPPPAGKCTLLEVTGNTIEISWPPIPSAETYDVHLCEFGKILSSEVQDSLALIGTEIPTSEVEDTIGHSPSHVVEGTQQSLFSSQQGKEPGVLTLGTYPEAPNVLSMALPFVDHGASTSREKAQYPVNLGANTSVNLISHVTPNINVVDAIPTVSKPRGYPTSTAPCVTKPDMMALLGSAPGNASFQKSSAGAPLRRSPDKFFPSSVLDRKVSVQMSESGGLATLTHLEDLEKQEGPTSKKARPGISRWSSKKSAVVAHTSPSSEYAISPKTKKLKEKKCTSSQTTLLRDNPHVPTSTAFQNTVGVIKKAPKIGSALSSEFCEFKDSQLAVSKDSTGYTMSVGQENVTHVQSRFQSNDLKWFYAGVVTKPTCVIRGYIVPDEEVFKATAKGVSKGDETTNVVMEKEPVASTSKDTAEGRDKCGLTVNGILPSTTYGIRVAGVNSCGRGDWSEILVVSTAAFCLPGHPYNVTVTTTTEGDINLLWEIDREEFATEYAVRLLKAKSTNMKLSGGPKKYSIKEIKYEEVYVGPAKSCVVPKSELLSAHISNDKPQPSVLFHIFARNCHGEGKATQVRWFLGNKTKRKRYIPVK